MAVQAVTEYLERVAQLKVTGVLDTFLGLIHHKSTWWLHDSDRHRNFVRTDDLTPLEPSEHKFCRHFGNVHQRDSALQIEHPLSATTQTSR